MSTQWVADHVARQRAESEELYQSLHRNPELSMQETETVAEIRWRLEGHGYDIREIGGGVVGVLSNGDGPTVMFRADIDALPVEESTGLPYASTKTMADREGNIVPVMHACGHDVHITAGLAAARVLAEGRDHWRGTYVALFQPAEETAEGARSMVADGLVDKVPRPDVVLGQHVLTTPAAGHVGTRPGAMLSTGGSVRVTVHGSGSHGSMPHLGVDPVLLASSIVVRLQGIVAREIDPFKMAVVTVGSLQAGKKSNIIPDHAVLLINVRAYDNGVRDHLMSSIERIVRAECSASGSPREPEFHAYDQYPLTDNDADVTTRVHAAFVEHFGADRVAELDPVSASEDFSLLPTAFRAPYSYWGVGGFLPDQPVFPNHNPGFAPAMQPTLATGSEAAVVAALAWLGKE
ncbi:amidohydrolase [Tessaracoccus sp. MC1756]|uniref:amidohydrolase n=1 Tax=Tessaracoccus sp. MC1756 TaxID=2760311 RepID=UPI001602E99E|nr:amidohydrolase [Tessaracoccus sp. MC1756]MBB1510327.1 amidohydrolase [Tessaracoccus sp. MC1756]